MNRGFIQGSHAKNEGNLTGRFGCFEVLEKVGSNGRNIMYAVRCCECGAVSIRPSEQIQRAKKVSRKRCQKCQVSKTTE
jgi:hypothetical protein